MQSMVALRTISQIVKSKFSTFINSEAVGLKTRPQFISVVCGFPKDLRSKYKTGKFGDDAWFTSTSRNADVIGEKKFLSHVICFLIPLHPLPPSHIYSI